MFSMLPTGALGISDLLRASTRDLHGIAERTGVVKEILRGRISKDVYAVYLRNLAAVYGGLEKGLTLHRRTRGVGRLYQPAVFRFQSLVSDLTAIVGAGWEESLPLLAAGERYVHRVESAAQGSGSALIAHAYVRYLGDLSGGQVVRKALARHPGLPASALAFYGFPLISDLPAFKIQYRQAVDLAEREAGDRAEIVDEALVAFRLNISLSDEAGRAGQSPARSF